ncbi:MAG: DUF1697 domain-containing protein [Trueperaceae bacterium]|nr:DUF1697 domain-containing protein [Trueperaceae bacterium]
MAFRPAVALLSADELHRVADANPFPEAEGKPTTLHAFFPASLPQAPNLAALEEVCSNGEPCALRGNVPYVHAPNGLGRSKLPQRVPSVLGVEVTARNWRTVRGLLALAVELQG